MVIAVCPRMKLSLSTPDSFNMSWTLSIGKIGPGLDSFEPRPGLFFTSTLLRRPRRVFRRPPSQLGTGARECQGRPSGVVGRVGNTPSPRRTRRCSHVQMRARFFRWLFRACSAGSCSSMGGQGIRLFIQYSTYGTFQGSF